jgi:4-aminobutyrate aminotransferase / (S)-3-amino-2-methylpropionate transaminase / 5-aminovalerate transaminase
MNVNPGLSIEQLNEYMIANTNSSPVIATGKGAIVTDETGKTYIDLEAGPGVASVGHCHPKVVAAIREQAGKLLQSPGRYHSRQSLLLAYRLCELTGNRMSRVFVANSGAEANDGAIKAALKHAAQTGKQGFGIIAYEHGFHGRTNIGLSLSGLSSRKRGFGTYGMFPGIVHISPPYEYRYGQSDPLQSLEMALKTRMPGDPAILISEPVWCVGGVIVPPDDYWLRIQDFCHKHKITIIMDEVFSGFGRTGHLFGHMRYGIEPDVISFAKAIGGGVPMAGYMTNEAVGSAIQKGDHFTTFGMNNQIGTSAAHAVLDILAEEDLIARARRSGERLMDGLRGLEARYEAIGEVRGVGLMLGVELVKNRQSREPAPELATAIQKRLAELGVLISITGVLGCVLRITPPLVITDDEIDESIRLLDRALRELTAG